MTAALNTNGRVRKSLAEQIDRLDGILDGLADGLEQAVATAVRDAVGLAVKEAVRCLLTEVLTDPDLLMKLHGLTVPPVAADTRTAPAAAPVLTRTVWRDRLAGLAGRAKAGLRRVCRGVGTAWERVQVVKRFKNQLLIALAVGAALGAAAYLAGPYVAAAAAWLGGFATALAVQAGLALRRLAASMAEAEVHALRAFSNDWPVNLAGAWSRQATGSRPGSARAAVAKAARERDTEEKEGAPPRSSRAGEGGALTSMSMFQLDQS